MYVGFGTMPGSGLMSTLNSSPYSWAERAIIGACLAFGLWWLQNQWSAFEQFRVEVRQGFVNASDIRGQATTRLSVLETENRILKDDLAEMKTDIRAISLGVQEALRRLAVEEDRSIPAHPNPR
jgi:hypothetical protein